MPRADSGRIVVHVDPMLKRRLYAALAMESSTLKEWFTKSVERYLKENTPSSAAFVENREETKR